MAEDASIDDDRVGVALRPVGSSLPLGMAGLLGASLVLSGLQLGWISASQHTIAGVLVLCTGTALQSIAAVIAFAARDGVAGSSIGTLAAGWAASGFVLILSPAGSASTALGTLLLGLGVLLVLFATSVAVRKLVAAVAIGLAGVRFVTTGVFEMSSATVWQHVSGVAGLAVVAVAAYAAFAHELEDASQRAVLPIGRRQARNDPAREPGARPRL
jgi:succinate-acetate transporter protein